VKEAENRTGEIRKEWTGEYRNALFELARSEVKVRFCWRRSTEVGMEEVQEQEM